jgi:predicted house-cleaning noncanonical NTP pyrophosphatase (MazG superfamily)
MKKLDKLVRDNIPAIMVNAGQTVVYRKVQDDEEFLLYAIRKLQEETEEFVDASGIGKPLEPAREELTDIFEALLAIADMYDMGWMELRDRANRKREEKGGFTKRYVVVEVNGDAA